MRGKGEAEEGEAERLVEEILKAQSRKEVVVSQSSWRRRR